MSKPSISVPAESHPTTLDMFLGYDLSGRSLPELLHLAAQMLTGRGDGPVADCLRDKAYQAEAALVDAASSSLLPALNLHDLQTRMVAWGIRCFGAEHMANAEVRGLRLVEESIEFAQSVDVPAEKVHALIDYVYSREKGSPAQELGGVGVTWLAAAHSLGKSAIDVLSDEVKRVESKTPEHFAKRNQDKIDLGFDRVASLPVGRQLEQCSTHGSSSRICEKGTRCCVVQHRASLPVGESQPRTHDCSKNLIASEERGSLGNGDWPAHCGQCGRSFRNRDELNRFAGPNKEVNSKEK